jgi:hypothetical protein
MATAAGWAMPGPPTVPATTVSVGTGLRPRTPRGHRRTRQGSTGIAPYLTRPIRRDRAAAWDVRPRRGNSTARGVGPRRDSRPTPTVTAGIPAGTEVPLSASHTTPCACG